MKHLKKFSLFEGHTSSYRFTFPLPNNQEETDALKNYSESKDLISVSNIIYKQDPVFIYNKGSVIIKFKDWSYDFKMTKKGTLYYGGIQVGPSAELGLNDIRSIIDFITLYTISRNLQININNIDTFVFKGKGISDNSFGLIINSPFKDIFLKMSKKYNGNDLIDNLVNKKQIELSKFITDPNTIYETEAFKVFNNAFKLETKIGKNNQCFIYVPTNLTAFGVLDPLIKSYDRSSEASICLGPLSDFIKVKTKRGLEKAVYSEISERIKSEYRIQSYMIKREITPENSYLIELLEIGEKINENFINGTSFTGGDADAIIIRILEEFKNTDPLKFAKCMSSIQKSGGLQNIVNHFDRDKDIIRGGSLLTRFGLGEDND